MVWFKSVVGSWERDANWILKIYVMIQGADLRRLDKYKQRATLGMGEYSPVMNCTLFCGAQGIQYGWVSTPYHLMLYKNGIAK